MGHGVKRDERSGETGETGKDNRGQGAEVGRQKSEVGLRNYRVAICSA